MEERQLAVSRYSDTFMNSNILVIWKWGNSQDVYISNPMLRSTEFGVNQQVVIRVMIPKVTIEPPSFLPSPPGGITNELPTYRPPLDNNTPSYTPNTPKANIPSWLMNQTPQVAENYLKVLNPGFTVMRIPEGSVMTADYRPNRIVVTHNSSNRVTKITQG
jgi:hypothetical protein